MVAKESGSATHFLDVFERGGPVFDASDLRRVNHQFPIFDVNAKVVHFRLEELAFCWFEVQRVLLQYVKEHMTYFRVEVFLVEGGHNDNVVHIMPKHSRVPGIDWAEDFVKHPSKSGRGVA